MRRALPLILIVLAACAPATPVEFRPRPGSTGPFSEAVRAGNILFLSGMLGTDSTGRDILARLVYGFRLAIAFADGIEIRHRGSKLGPLWALLNPLTMLALYFVVFGGAIVTEQIFRVPGIGSLLISSILANDTPVIMAVTFVFACLVILFNLIADVLYGWLDPRISYR